MKYNRLFILLIITYSIENTLFAQVTFQKVIGGTTYDGAYSVDQTRDTGYIVAGFTSSFGAGSEDIYLLKFDKYGDTTWTKTYGGTGGEHANTVHQTFDGGYVISSTGFLMKTDANGDTIWTRILNRGGAVFQQTLDSGFIIAGATSTGAGGTDVCLIKTDSMGNFIWEKSYGGIGDEYAKSVEQTKDSGYIIIGITNSFGSGNRSIYLLKTDKDGNLMWSNAYGDPGEINEGNSVTQTNDGGYILAGKTGGYVSMLSKSILIKSDSIGNIVWSKTVGSSDFDHANSIQLTNDNCFIVSGYHKHPIAFVSYAFLFKFDSSGDTIWTRSFLAASNDWGNSVKQTNDSGFVIAGISANGQPNSANVYLIKTDINGNTTCNNYGSTIPVANWSPPVTSAATIVTIDTVIFSTSSISVGSGGGDITELCADVGIEEFSIADRILISPNPFTSELKIVGTEKNKFLLIFDLTGKEIFHQRASEGETKINTSDFVNGFYILSYINKNETTKINVKLLKMAD